MDIAQATAVAPAKINLLLRAGAARPDGYHPLLTVFQAIDLWERVTVSLRPEPGIGVRVIGRQATQVPTGPANLAVKAAAVVAAEAGIEPAIDILINKAIPVAGGLAGGSADAAATLVACDQLWRAGLGDSGRHRLAAELGSDVNFCLAGGTAIGRGRGELLTAVESAKYHWVLITSRRGLSTPAVFAQLDAMRATQPAPAVEPRQAAQPTQAAASGALLSPTEVAASDVELSTALLPQMLQALHDGDPAALAPHLANDLQAPALDLAPDLANVMATASECGALTSFITGSGPTVVALAKDRQHADMIATELAVRFGQEAILAAIGPMGGASLAVESRPE